MKILITGGTGFIGRTLCPSLVSKGHELCVLTRSVIRARRLLPREKLRFITDFSQIKPEESFDAVINLAGAPIAKRWTSTYKKKLLDSRVKLTERLIARLATCPHPPAVFISGSAIGYYGPQGDEILAESAAIQPGFSHDLCLAWEQAALKANATRICLLRTGIVLGKQGGALQRMRLPFLFGMGGPIGEGTQWMSWIHISDMVRVIHFCLEQPALQGPINATSPQPATNKDFAKTYGKVLHRPAILPMPAFIVRLLFGEMGEELLLTGQRVVPTRLIEHGFSFVYPELELALLAIEK